MVKLAFLARFEAKPGKEEELAGLMAQALELAKSESTTISWYALRISPSVFGVFDTFNDEDGRQRHFNGSIPKALKASGLLAAPPSVEPVDILAFKA